MRNQPKYKFQKNAIYALNGLKEIFQNETSFKIELVFFALLLPVVIFWQIGMIEKILLFSSLLFVLIAECVNSAIERCVDLVTSEFNQMAGKAKDAGSAVVFLSIVNACVVWIFIIVSQFFLGEG